VFVCFEGIDGAGKTTQALNLVERLKTEGVPAERVFDPGTTRVGQAIREILLNNDEPMSRMAQMLLFSAARAELAEHIARQVAQGVVVICDRWLLSTLVYQGHGNQIDPQLILSIYRGTSDIVPDLCFLLDITAEEAARRVGPPRDRYERKSLSDRQAMRDVYRHYAEQNAVTIARQIHILDASAAEQDTHAAVYKLFCRAHTVCRSKPV
jgi:dTMP kinase